MSLLSGPKLDCRYLGGHRHYRREMDGTLVVRGGNLRFTAVHSFSVPVSQISSVHVDSSGQFERRATAGRVLATGILALVVKKRSSTPTNFMTVELEDGQALVFEADSLRTKQLGPLYKQPKGERARGFAAYLRSEAARARKSGAVGGVTRQMGGLAAEASRIAKDSAVVGSGAVAGVRARADLDRCPCPSCGEQIKLAAKVCRFCGHRLGGAAPAKTD